MAAKLGSLRVASSAAPLWCGIRACECGALGAPVSAQKRNAKYHRMLWLPSFPSDLPPALRQNAEIVRYAAPEVTPHERVWTIHTSSRLRDIALRLCAQGAVQELAANVIFHALTSVDCKDPAEARRRAALFKSDLFTTCSNLFEAHHVHEGAECIFGVLNPSVLQEVSPKLRPNRMLLMRSLVMDTFDKWVKSHAEPFSHLNATRLLQVVGPKEFYKLIPQLHLNIRALRGEDVDVLLYHLVHEANDIFATMRIALSLIPVHSINEPLGGSSWTLYRVLELVEVRRSEHALRFFIAHLHPSSIVKELLVALRERDFDTGLLRNKWAYMASVKIALESSLDREFLPPAPNVWPMLPVAPPALYFDPIDDALEVERGQRIFLTDGELRPFSITVQRPKSLGTLVPPSRLRDTAWPQLAFDPARALSVDRGEVPGSRSVDVYFAMQAGADIGDELKLWAQGSDQIWGSTTAPPQVVGGLPAPHSTLPFDAVHFIDSVQALSHVLTFLQQAPPEFVGFDLEWTDPHPVSLLQIATPYRVFVIDTMSRTELYMSLLHALVDWLLKREATTKLFFGFPHDLIRLNLLFEPMGRSFGAADHIASVIDLYTQRVRRVYAPSLRQEDTPLGRETILGQALMAGDLEMVRSVGRLPRLHEIPGEMVERVFQVGGHQSLSQLVERFLNIKMDKSLRSSNWNFRPLSTAQVMYAATDAHILLRAEAAMRERDVLPLRVWGCGRRHPAFQAAWWKPAQICTDAGVEGAC